MEDIGIDLGGKESQVCVRNGVGETLHMNLLPDERPVWRLKASVDGSKPAICGHRKSGHFRRSRRALIFTSRHPVFASSSGAWCASDLPTVFRTN